MNTFIQKEVAKLTLPNEDIYVCMFVQTSEGKQNLINLHFYRKMDGSYLQVDKETESVETRKELISRVRENRVEKIDDEELKDFLRKTAEANLKVATQLKMSLNKTMNNIKVVYIGEIAGLAYMVTKQKNSVYYEAYHLNSGGDGEEFQVQQVPLPFMELVLLDFLQHNKNNAKPFYVMFYEELFMGVNKSSVNPSHFHVVSIEMEPYSVSAIKAYTIKRKSPHEYIPLPIEETSATHLEVLQKEATSIVNQFIEKMNFIVRK